MTSPPLADFAQRLQNKVRKMDAVHDFTEQHEDKYMRLFLFNQVTANTVTAGSLEDYEVDS